MSRVVGNEVGIPPYKAYKRPHLLLGAWVLGITNGFDLEGQASLLDAGQDLSQMLEMVLPGMAEDDHIIKVSSTEGFEPCENSIHQPLECRRRFMQSKRHYCELVQP